MAQLTGHDLDLPRDGSAEKLEALFKGYKEQVTIWVVSLWIIVLEFEFTNLDQNPPAFYAYYVGGCLLVGGVAYRCLAPIAFALDWPRRNRVIAAAVIGVCSPFLYGMMVPLVVQALTTWEFQRYRVTKRFFEPVMKKAVEERLTQLRERDTTEPSPRSSWV